MSGSEGAELSPWIPSPKSCLAAPLRLPWCPPATAARVVLGHPLALITHLLDAFTVHGTQLWWPLPVRPTMWSTVFIIDPLYTYTVWQRIWHTPGA